MPFRGLRERWAGCRTVKRRLPREVAGASSTSMGSVFVFCLHQGGGCLNPRIPLPAQQRFLGVYLDAARLLLLSTRSHSEGEGAGVGKGSSEWQGREVRDNGLNDVNSMEFKRRRDQ